jgi:vacuolar protein sorting-associated protein 54
LTQQEKSSILARNLRALGPEEAAVFFSNVYCNIGEVLRRLHLQIKILLDLTSSLEKTSSSAPGFESQEDLTHALDISSLLEEAVENAQSEIVKVLRVRAEQTINLEFDKFLNYFTLNRLFVDECETVSGYTGAAFKVVMNDHFQKFVTQLHEAERQRLAQRMESEKWERVDFGSEDAVILARILQSTTSNPPAWLKYANAAIAGRNAGEQTNEHSAENASITTHHRKGMILAAIEQDTFMIVDSAAFALRGIEQYMILLVSAPNMANLISTAMLDHLKLFNSRTQQLILGAGAKLTAGLTTINAKHLALASQSLSLFIALIPYTRGFVQRRSNTASSGMEEFDRLKRAFLEHQSFIYDKLVDIMSSRATTCIRAMEIAEWDEADEVEKNISPCVEKLVTEVLTLKRVLNKFLPPASAEMIMGRVFVNFKEQFIKIFEVAVVHTDAGQAR